MARKPVGSRRTAVPRLTLAERRAAESHRVDALLTRLDREFPDAYCALGHDSPFQLLVATILSAQCTDERVNRTTPALFAKFPTAEGLARASQAEVEQIVKPLGFFRAKAKNLREMAHALVEQHGGQVPSTLEERPGQSRAGSDLAIAAREMDSVFASTHSAWTENLHRPAPQVRGLPAAGMVSANGAGSTGVFCSRGLVVGEMKVRGWSCERSNLRALTLPALVETDTGPLFWRRLITR